MHTDVSCRFAIFNNLISAVQKKQYIPNDNLPLVYTYLPLECQVYIKYWTRCYSLGQDLSRYTIALVLGIREVSARTVMKM